MNTSSNTSFDPMDWYKQLTTCLATKKNCKINLSRVPGGKEIKENKRMPPRITNQHLQSKFLAKYNEKRQQQESENAQNAMSKPGALGFNLQTGDQNGKRQKPDDDCINLPPTYFQSTNVPDLSIFKVPEVPPAKRPRVEPSNTTTVARATTNNFTLESLFSGNFKPPKASTPIEELRPIISDPGDILGEINKTRLNCGETVEKLINEEDSKLKEFIVLMDSVAQKIDTTCFSKISDPLVEIISRLNEIHEIATQSPRSSLCGNSPARKNDTMSSRPIPTFYDHQEMDVESNMGELDSLFNKSFRSVSILPSTTSRLKNIEDDIIATPLFNNVSSSPIDYLFGTSSKKLSPVSIDNESVLSQVTHQSTDDSVSNQDENEFNWLDEVFNNSMDFDSDENDDIDDSVNTKIFRSPPSQRSRKNELQKKFSQAVNSRHAFKNNHNVSNNSSIWSKYQNNQQNDDGVFDITLDLL